MCYFIVAANSQQLPNYIRKVYRHFFSTAMARSHAILFLKLVAISVVVLSSEHNVGEQDGSQRLIYMAVILPDAGRRFSSWPFSIQNVSSAIDVALRRVSSQQIAFDVRYECMSLRDASSLLACDDAVTERNSTRPVVKNFEISIFLLCTISCWHSLGCLQIVDVNRFKLITVAGLIETFWYRKQFLVEFQI